MGRRKDLLMVEAVAAVEKTKPIVNRVKKQEMTDIQSIRSFLIQIEQVGQQRRMSRHIHACIALLCLVVCRLTGLPDTITLTDQGIMIRKISWGRKKDRTPLLFFRSPNMCKLTDITACVLLGYTGNFQHCCQGRSFIMYMLNSKYLAGSCKNAINLPFHKMNEIS